MRLSTKGIYGVLAVLDLTVHQTEVCFSAEHCRRHRLSESYLEHCSVLRKRGIDRSRGSRRIRIKRPEKHYGRMVLEAWRDL